MTNSKYSIFDRMIEGVQIISSDWRYIYLNDTVIRHGKFSREELLGYTMMEKYPGIEKSEMFTHLRSCMEDGIPHQMMNEFTFPNGSKGYFELRMQMIEEGVLILSIDVTSQKEAEQILQYSNAVLDEKVRRRTTELTARNNELEQFTYIASHDLQEPLRAVSNYIKVLEEDYAKKLDDTAIGYLNSMQQAVDRMSRLTRSLLNYSKLGRATNLKKIDITVLIREVLADLDQMIKLSDAMIIVDPMPMINGYEIELRQLFQNLISNAIKFCKKNTRPEVHIRAEDQGDKWMFSVCDNGIGIEKDHYEKIFLIFQRLHLREKYEGDGIGLANCRKIAELHEGEIFVESVVNQGSIFKFTISKLKP